jgi:hypothetical protein
MLETLEKLNVKRFDLMPHMQLGMHHVHLGSRYLSVIYNEWKKLKKNKINIQDFAKNYEKYYKEMFNLNYFNKRKDLKNLIPVSFSSDGIAISCMFRTEKKTKIKSDNKDEKKKDIPKIDLAKLQIIKGFYDADEVLCNELFLNQFHIIGVDPGNADMLTCVSETGRTFVISKAFYYQIAHINANKKKRESLEKKSEISEIFKLLALETHRTADINTYLKYFKKVCDNWNKIWNFYSSFKMNRLKFDGYIHKQRAITTIVRKITQKRHKQKRKQGKSKESSKEQDRINIELKKQYENDKNKFDTNLLSKLGINIDKTYSGTNKYFDKIKYEILKNLPILFAFGKGNGSLTISNTKGTGPKGPVKRILIELSKKALVLGTDENNSSKLTNCHEEVAEHPEMIHFRKKEKTGKDANGDNVYKTDVTGEVYESYKLCCCQSSNNRCHKLWNRDINAALNMMKIMKRKVLGENLGKYKRKPPKQTIVGTTSVPQVVCVNQTKNVSVKTAP